MNGLTNNKHQPARIYSLFVCLFVGCCFAGWLVRLLDAWLIDWFGWLVGSFVRSFKRCFIHWLVGCMVD